MPYELFYWPGNFAGRGEFVRLLLFVADQEFVEPAKTKENGVQQVLQYLHGAQPNGEKTMPTFAPPVLKDGDFILAQAVAIGVYIGKKHGLFPTNAIEEAHCLQIMLQSADVLAEAGPAYHPKGHLVPFKDQAAEARPLIDTFLEERLTKHLKFFQNALKANNDGTGFFIGSSLTTADLWVFQMLRGYRSSEKEHFNNNKDIDLLKAWLKRMEAEDKIAAFLKSDKSTKMEAETSGPVAEAPNVITNSFC
mmetsp:Transcript_11339/g.18975  ORF Transcript_11339/g.18975 Transcript_11339/m.18975 type:complete len:250 (-) Transcript_11339:152-901(-)